jgi:hypothetical protein
MEIKMVSYQEIFNLGNYCSQRIGVEVAVNLGEDAKQALEVARNLVHEYHQQTAPEEIQRGTVIRDLKPEQPMTNETRKEQQISGFMEAINTVTSLKSLEIFKKLVERENNPQLTEAYDNKLKTFQ